MSTETLWNHLRAKASLSEFEIHTVPQNKSVPLWFLEGKKEKHLVIKKAKLYSPSVNISMGRTITFKDFEYVHRYHERWLKGDTSSRQEAAKKSQNTAYIFTLIAEANKVSI